MTTAAPTCKYDVGSCGGRTVFCFLFFSEVAVCPILKDRESNRQSQKKDTI